MNAIIGTAGHIDHGKTELVRALTGIDTDRLPEEKLRGVSIELGFAWLELADGDRAGIVDVPGHERFIRQMLAGAHGFDLVLVVVAADDGVMPQTEEHFEICHLLGVRKAVFVVTKADLADAGRIDEVRTEIEILAAGTRFAGAPVIVVSATRGTGIEELRAAVLDALGDLERPLVAGPFRLPVDRVFVLKGHGVVVTGTAGGGRVAIGEDVTVLPAGRAVRVREIQIHGVTRDQARSGQRVALNLAGVDRNAVARGDTIVGGGSVTTTERIDVRVEVRPSAGKAVRSHTRVRVHLGTREMAGRLVWLGGKRAVETRSSGYAQIELGEQAVVFAGDRFVVRSENAGRTLGGGVVLHAHADRHRSDDAAVVERLGMLEGGDRGARLLALADSLTDLGAAPEQLAGELGIAAEEVEALAAADGSGLVLLRDAAGGALVVAAERVLLCRRKAGEAVRRHHERSPNLPGIDLERLRASAPWPTEPRWFRMLVDAMVADGGLVRQGNTVALDGHRVAMSDEDEALARRVVEILAAGGATPPTTKQLVEELGITPARLATVVGVLVARGLVAKVGADLVFERAALDEIEVRLRDYLARAPEITAATFRDLIGASRRYSIALLDYFDRSGVTLRSGDMRKLRSTTEQQPMQR